MKTYIVLILAAFIIASCSNSRKDTVASLKEEVMALHDEVMPKMGELHKLQKQLLTMADTTEETDSLMAAEYRELAQTIELANESMMDWMRNYEPNYEGSEEELIDYLKEQKESISKVRDEMFRSLEAGETATQ